LDPNSFCCKTSLDVLKIQTQIFGSEYIWIKI